jgi:hypothetical protein
MAWLPANVGSSAFHYGHRVGAHTDVTVSCEDVRLIEHLEVWIQRVGNRNGEEKLSA